MNQEATNDATLNTESGGSSVPAQKGGLVSTVEFTSKPDQADADPEGANNSEGTDLKDGSEDGQGAAGKEGQADTKTDGEDSEDKEKLSGQDDRLDKHPRFQELRTRAENAEAQANKLSQRIDALEKSTKTPTGKDGAEELPFKDISKMTSDELLDWQSEDPHAYHKNVLAQAKFELGQDFENRIQQKSGEDAIVETYESFAQNNPDFDKMWDDGKLQDYIDKNPGHNAISAYLAMTGEARTQEAIDKAIADAEKKFTANQKAKRENKSLGGGPQTTGSQQGPVATELQDTKKFGGPITVMASRLAAFRKKQAGLG